ncbi:hypothetical protein VTH82DRAFT_4845, partial [Thermothelomyces myriococcoides]
MTSASSGERGGHPGPPDASTDDKPHNSLGPNILATCFVTWTIALIFVLLRFWTRTKIVRLLGPADWCIALALVVAAGLCVGYVLQVNLALGKHVWDVDTRKVWPQFVRAWSITLILYSATLSLTKISICLLYLKIFTFEWARRTAWIVLSIVVVISLYTIAIPLTHCIPLEATWDKTIEASYCHPGAAWWTSVGVTIATDVLIFIFPVPFVAPLNLPRRQKIIVLGIFTIGFCICIVSFIRLYTLIKAMNSTDPDFTYAPATLSYLSVLEVHIGIVVSCAMTLKPLVDHYFPGLLASSGTNSGGIMGLRAGLSSSSANNSSSLPQQQQILTVGPRPRRRNNPLRSWTTATNVDEDETA